MSLPLNPSLCGNADAETAVDAILGVAGEPVFVLPSFQFNIDLGQDTGAIVTVRIHHYPLTVMFTCSLLPENPQSRLHT